MYKSKTLKSLCLLLSVIFIFAMMLTGCGSSAPKAAETTTAGTSTISESTASASTHEAPKLDYAELTWYLPPPISPEKNQDNVMAEVNKQLKEKLNVKLTFNFIDWGNYDDKLRVMSAAGDPYDLTMATSWTNKLPINVAKGFYLPLDDLLAQYGQHVSAKVESKYWSATTFNGKVYAIPNPTTYASTSSFSYKRDLVDKYNFDYKNVHTLKELEPYLEIIKKNENGITPLCATAKSTPGLTEEGIDKVNGFIGYNIKDSKFITFFDIQDRIDQFKTLSDFYKKGYIAKDAATKTDYAAEGKSGKYAVMPSPGAYSEDGSKATTVYGFPCYESLYKQGLVSTNTVQGSTTAISKTSKNPDRAMMLVDLLYSDKKFFNTVCYGIKGQDYTVVSGAGTDNPTVKTNADMTWMVYHPWIGSLFDQWPSNLNTQEALDKMKKYNDSSTISPLLGFNFDTEPVKQEVSQIQAIIDEIKPVLETGTASDVDDYLAKGKERCVKAGLDNVMTEVRKQYEAWKAANGK
ncbi:MAG: extracellular solute-binding protein [Clostridiaceae bacterium]